MNYPASVTDLSRQGKRMATSKAAVSRLPAVRTPRRPNKSLPASTRNFMERLPSEILIKILSYLDASALFSISHVNKLFYQLANDNSLWKRIYIAEFIKGELRCACTCQKQEASAFSRKKLRLKVETPAVSSWKWLYFKSVDARDMDTWRRHLKPMSRYTGLPRHTEKVLRNLNITWELTVTNKSGHQKTLEPSWSQFSETSVTLCWSAGGYLPSYQQISTLQLHGVRRIALNCPGLQKPGWRSLMAKLDMQTLTKNAQVIGQDRVVQLKLLPPGIIVGVWRDQRSVAFIMFTLHFHKLVERSTQGSSVCPHVVPVINAPFDDIDPEYGLHGYQLHIVLHGAERKLMSERFSQLFCHRAQISDGLIQLTAIDSENVSQHIPLSGNITLPWRCEALQGEVENCCMMSATLLDEHGNPFICVTSPVSTTPEKSPVSFDYGGEHHLIHYRDSDTQVKMRLVWTEEQQQFVLVSLVVYLSVCNVNKHFGTDY